MLSALVFSTSARAVTYYWDSNGTATAGAGATPTGTWGSSAFWSTDSTGANVGSPTLVSATTNADDLFFVAGPGTASGNNSYTVTVSTTRVANSLTFQASGATTLSGGTSITLGNGTAAAGGITMNQFAYGSTAQGAVGISTPVILNNSQTWTNNSAASLTVSGGLNNNGNLLTVAGSGNVTFNSAAGGISGAGGLTMNGTGVLNLSSAAPVPSHTYTGPTTINGGYLLYGGGNNIGTGTANITLNGGVLGIYFGGSFTRAQGTGASQIQITGGTSGFSSQGNSNTTFNIGTTAQWGSATFNPSVFVLQGGPGQSNANGLLTFSSNIDLNGANRTISSSGISYAGGGVSNITGNITGTGTSSSLTKIGSGPLTLSGTNTYGGSTTVSAGILDLGTIALGFGSGRDISVAPGAVVRRSTIDNTFLNRLVESSNEFGVFTGTTGNNIDLGGSTGATLPNAFVHGVATNGAKTEYSGTMTPGGGNYRLGYSLGNGLFAMLNTAPMTGTNGLIVGGTSPELVGAKTFSGTTTIRDACKLGLAAFTGSSVALGLQNSVLDTGTPSNTGNIWLEATTAGSATGAAVTTSATFGGLTGSRNLSSVYSTTTGANNSAATPVASITGFTLNPGTGQTPVYSGAISNFASGTTLTKTGAGTQTLSGTNTYTGQTTISAGVLVVSGGAAIADSGLISIANAAGATLQLGTNETIGNLTGGGTTGGAVDLQANTLTVGDASNQTFSGLISGTGGSLVKRGAGSLSLAASNTYTGTTSVTAGTLALAFGTVSSDILSSSSTLTLGGGTLQMTGTGTQTVNGLTTTANTTSSIVLGANQTLTLGGLTAAGASSSLNFNTAAGGADANTATVGTSVVVLTGQTPGVPINSNFTVRDSTGFGLATVNGSDQVVRMTTGSTLLPDSGATSATDYLVDNNPGGISAAGSSILTLSASQSARSITVDTTAAAGTLTAAGFTLSNNLWNIGGPNAYTITGGSLNSVASGNAITIANYSTGIVTFGSSIVANGTNALVLSGTGTTVLGGTNTHTGGTAVTGGTVSLGSSGALGSSGTISFAGGTLQSTASNTTDYSGRFSTAAGQAYSFDTNGLTLTLGTALTSSGGTLTKLGAGTLILSGASTYTGATTISGGTLQIGNGGATGALSASGIINNNGVLAFSRTTVTQGTDFGVIGGTGSLTLTTGTLTLNSANNTYSGGTALSGGKLIITADSNLGAAGTAITFNGSAQMQAAGITLARNIAINSGIASFGGNSVTTISGNVTGAGGIAADPFNFGSVVILNGTANTFQGLVQIGNGGSGANQYYFSTASLADSGTANGNIVMNYSGTYTTNPFGFWWTGTSNLTLNNRAIVLANTGGTPGNNIQNNSPTAGVGIIINTDLQVSGSGARALGLGGTNTSGTSVFAGALANGTGTVSVTKTGSGIWALSGTNTYTGATTMGFNNPSGGSLIFRGLQSLSPSTSLSETHAGGTGGFGTFKLLDDSATPASRSTVAINMTSSNTSHGLNVFVGNNSVANGGSSSSTQTGSTITLGNLTMTQSVSGNTSQEFILSGANSYRLQIGAVSVATAAANAASYTAKFTPSTPLTISGNVQQTAGSSAGSAVTLNLDGTASGNLISGNILNSADGTPKVLGISKTNTSSWTLSGTGNTYSGTTTITGGTLATAVAAQGFGTNLNGISIGGSGTLSLLNDSTTSFTNGTSAYNIANSAAGATINVDRVSGTGTNVITVGNLTTTSNSVTWDLKFTGANGVGLSAGALTTPTAAAGSHTINNNIAGGGSLTLASVAGGGTGAAATLIFAGSANTTVTGAISQTATAQALTKNGNGILTLNGSNSYSGATSVTAGKLFVNGTTAAGAVSVSANATLGGTGTIGGSTTIAASGKLEFDISTAPAIHDKLDLAATRTLTFSGASTLTINSVSGAATGDYTLVTAPGGITGSVPATLVLPPGWAATVTKENSNTDLVLHVTSTGGDTTPPTLTSIADNKSGGPVDINTLVTYTVTFNEDMDAGTVSAADFGNAGTAAVTIGTVTETTPGVFSVQATPTGPGTLELRINSGAVLKDVAGNDLVTTSALLDDTTITVRTTYETWASGTFANAFTDTNPANNQDGDGLTNLQEYAFGTDPTVSSGGSITWVAGGAVTNPGLPVAFDFSSGGGGVDYRAVFGRRKDYLTAGLTYTVQFSADMLLWQNATATPTVLTGAGGANPSPIEAVSVPYPSLFVPLQSGGFGKATFLRVMVSY